MIRPIVTCLLSFSEAVFCLSAKRSFILFKIEGQTYTMTCHARDGVCIKEVLRRQFHTPGSRGQLVGKADTIGDLGT